MSLLMLISSLVRARSSRLRATIPHANIYHSSRSDVPLCYLQHYSGSLHAMTRGKRVIAYICKAYGWPPRRRSRHTGRMWSGTRPDYLRGSMVTGSWSDRTSRKLESHWRCTSTRARTPRRGPIRRALKWFSGPQSWARVLRQTSLRVKLYIQIGAPWVRGPANIEEHSASDCMLSISRLWQVCVFLGTLGSRTAPPQLSMAQWLKIARLPRPSRRSDNPPIYHGFLANMSLRCRSRTPPSRTPPSRISGTCCICLQELDGAPAWRCLVCPIIAHVDCMPRTPSGHIHLNNGCPVCRTTMTSAIQHFRTPFPAPFGAWCSLCFQPITPTTPMLRCAAPRTHCLATWHAQPTATCPGPIEAQHACPGCTLSTYNGLRFRVT